MTSAYETILRGFKWVVAHWYVPLIALAAGLGWLLGSRRSTPRKVLADELESIQRAQEIERFAAEKGAQLANEVIDQEHRRTLRRLDEQQKLKAYELRRNPGKRVRYLRRLSERLRNPPE